MSKTSPNLPLPQPAEADLPEGWATTPLGEVVSSAKGKKPANLFPEAQDELVPYVDIHAFETGECREFADPSDAKLASKGALLIVWDGARSGLVGRMPCNGAVGSTLAVLNPQAINVDYLQRFLQVNFDIINSNARGTGIPHVDPEILWNIELPVPPLAEQERIVANVSEVLERVDAARARLGKLPIILGRFRQSVLAAACSGRLTEGWREGHQLEAPVWLQLDQLRMEHSPPRTRRGVPERVEWPNDVDQPELPSSWAIVSVAELLRSGALIDVKDGNHGSNHPKAEDFTPSGLPFITAAQVANYQIDYEGAPRLAGRPLERLRVGFAEPGDAILTHKGSVGRAALNTRSCVLTPQTTYYRCNARLIHAPYVVYLLTSPQFYAQLSGVMSQTTRDFVPISEQYLLFFFLPPLAEQVEIVRRVDALFALVAQVEGQVRAATVRAEKLTQAIEVKAFRGELVPREAELAAREGRDYEPGSTLLARIREARSKEKPAGRGRGGKIMVRGSARRQPATGRKPLDEVLRQQGKPLTPERLFDLAGFDEDSVDGFYEQLRKLVQEGKVRENRPNNEEVYLEAAAT